MYKDLYKTLSKQEKTYSEEEVLEAIKECLLKKSLENPDVDIDTLQKSWRKAFANGLTVLGLMHGAHYMGSDGGQPSERQKSPTYQRIHQEMEAKKQKKPSSTDDSFFQEPEQDRDSKIKGFLDTISMNESSGGKNLNHKKMNSGIHSGDAAIGQYGLMPNTIKEMAGRMGPKHPLSRYSKMNSKSIIQKIKNNPQHEKEIATFMANHLHDKFGGDENKMSYSWNQGHNLTSEHFDNDHKNYLNHDYVKKYNQHKQSFKNKNLVTKTPDIE
jgi:hypothetical protein